MVLTNTGATSTTVSAITVGGTEFSVSGVTLPVSLAAGESVTLNVTFAPTATGWTGWTEGEVTFTGKASNPSIPLWLGGSGVSNELLTATPSSLSFGQTPVGTSAMLPIVLTNSHAHAQTLQAFQALGSQFSVSGPSVPMSIAPGQSVTLKVTFAPKTAGESGGSVFISGPSLNLPLTGTGATAAVGTLSITPTSMHFGNVMIGESVTQPALFTATGGSVTISSAASSSSQFSLPGVTFPVTINAGDSVQLRLSFTPQASGTSSGKVSFASNATDASKSEPVFGTGTTPQVSLGWSPSTSSVQGYNVYRGTAPGQYTKINPTLDSNTSYTDTTVAPGVTYYYAATAVNSGGVESTYSAPVEIQVP